MPTNIIMKGQYLLVNEVLLFVLGIFIVYFVATSFETIKIGINQVTTTDHMTALSDLFVLGIVKTFEAGDNTSMVFKMPEDLSVQTFRIRASGNQLIVSLYSDDRINLTREIFNISTSKVITGNLISSAQYVMITNNATHIEIRRISGG
jgi:hypothetical protein